MIQKIMARMGEREVIEISFDEMQNFIENGVRPDFYDATVVAVKFIVSDGDEDSETSWYVNPEYQQDSLDFYRDEMAEHSDEGDEGLEELYEVSECHDIKLAPEFLPELLLLFAEYPGVDILDHYSEFRLYQDRDDISDAQMVEEFINWMKDKEYII